MMNAGRLSVLLILLVIFFSSASSSHAITEAKERDIKELLAVMGTQTLATEMADILVTTVVAQEKQKFPNMPRKIEYAISNVIHQVVLEHASELDRMAMPLYDKYYTHEEIKGLISFFNSPVGKKYSSVIKPMMQDMMPIAQEWGKKIGTITALRVELELKRHGYK